MMEYIPGVMHESLQKEFFILLNSDFVWSICTKRYKDFGLASDWDDFTLPVDLIAGDIAVIRFFKPSDSSNALCYLERTIRGEKQIVYKTETTISLQFLEHNLRGVFIDKTSKKNESGIFTNVTKVMERDKKINLIFET